MHDPRNSHLLNESLKKCETLVQKISLRNLHQSTFCPVAPDGCDIYFFKIERLTASATPDFFTFVLNGLAALEATFSYILQTCHEMTYFYIVLKTKKNSLDAIELLKNGLQSTFPNSNFRELSPKESSLVLEALFDPLCYDALSSVIVVPNNTTVTHTPINEKFLDLMGKESYTALFLACPIKQAEVLCLISTLRELHTTLSRFSQTTQTHSHSCAKNEALSLSKADTESESNSCTHTDGDSHACNSSCYKQITGSSPLALSSTQAINISICKHDAHGSSHTDSHSLAKGETLSSSCAKTESQSKGNTITEHESIFFTERNKEVDDCLLALNQLIERLTLASRGAMFSFGAYFLSPKMATSLRGAFTYSGLAKTNGPDSEVSITTTWDKSDRIFPRLVKELSYFHHLSFEKSYKDDCLTTSTPISSTDLVNSFYFPYGGEGQKGCREFPDLKE